MLIDGIIIPVMAIVTLMGVSMMGFPGELGAVATVLSIFILEPFLVTTTGGTIGHHLIGIKVVNSQTMSTLGIIRATLRFVVKTFVGLISLI